MTQEYFIGKNDPSDFEIFCKICKINFHGQQKWGNVFCFCISIDLFLGESGNQMAVLVSPNADSVEVTWMPFSPNLAANISKITLEMTIENHTILQSIVPVDEISTRVKELNGAANPDKWVVFGSLIPGVGHTAFLSITGLEGQELYSNRVSFFTGKILVLVLKHTSSVF